MLYIEQDWSQMSGQKKSLRVNGGVRPTPVPGFNYGPLNVVFTPLPQTFNFAPPTYSVQQQQQLQFQQQHQAAPFASSFAPVPVSASTSGMNLSNQFSQSIFVPNASQNPVLNPTLNLNLNPEQPQQAPYPPLGTINAPAPIQSNSTRK